MKKLVIYIFSILFLAACASSTMSSAEKKAAYQEYIKTQQLVSVKKITAFNFSGWQSLTDNYLIVRSSQNKRYLLQLNGYCNDLNYEHTILINQSVSSMLSTTFDSIATTTNPQLKCFIKNIYPITKQQAKELQAIGKPAEDEK